MIKLRCRADKTSARRIPLEEGIGPRLGSGSRVMVCDEEVIPQSSRIESLTDKADHEAVYKTERTYSKWPVPRARDYLFVTAETPGSEFLKDLKTVNRDF